MRGRAGRESMPEQMRVREIKGEGRECRRDEGRGGGKGNG